MDLHGLAKLRARTVRASLAALGAIALGGSLIVAGAVAPAGAAVSSVTITVADDGSGPYDPSTTNDIAETHDQVQYAVGYQGGSGDETFTITLPAGTPAGVTFDPVSTSVCNPGAISNAGQTLTCTIAVNGTGAFYPVVNIDGTVPNGTPIDPNVSTSSGSSSALPVPTTVAAQLQLTVKKNQGVSIDAAANFNGQPGVELQYPITISAPNDITGAAMPTSPITFTDDLSAISPNAQLIACEYLGQGYTATFSGIPLSANSGYFSGYTPLTVQNSVPSTGTLGCAQTGGSISASISGGDYTGNNYNPWNSDVQPTLDSQNNPLPANAPKYLATFIVRVFVPNTDIPAGGLDTTNQIRDFAPTAVNFDGSTQQNVGADGADNGPTCSYIAPNPTDYCNSNHILPAPITPATAMTLRYTPVPMSTNPLPNEPASGDNKAIVTTGQNGYWGALQMFNYGLGDDTNHYVACLKWNSAQQQIDGAPVVYDAFGGLVTTGYTLEYGVLNYTPEASNAGGGCAGSDGSWSSSVAAAGGPGVVNAVRWTTTYSPASKAGYEYDVPLAVTATVPGTTIGLWGNVIAANDPTYLKASTFNDVTAAGEFGNRLTLVNAVDRLTKTTSNGATAVAAGATATYTLQPTVTAATAVTEHGVTITDVLPTCLAYIPASATGGPAGMTVTYTPGNPGPDGAACSGDAGETGGTLVFSLGDLVANSAIAPITYQVTASGIAPNNTAAPNTAVIGSSDIDAANAYANSASGTPNSGLSTDLDERTVTFLMTIGNTAAFSAQKTTANPLIEVGDSFTDSIAFVNSSGAPANVVVYDWFPVNGDAAGSVFSGSVTFASVTSIPLPGQTLSIECTSMLNPGPAGPWTALCDATSTGMRITAANTPNGGATSVNLTFTTAGTVNGDVIKNRIADVTTDIAGIPSIGPSAPAVTAVVGSTLAGTVYSDANNNGTMDAGETGIPGVTVAWAGSGPGTTSGSTTSAPDGTYSIPNLHSGDYVLTFTDPTTGNEWTIQGPGSVPDAAGVSAPIAVGATSDPTAPLTVTANAGVIRPAITIVKSASPTSVAAAGDVVSYSFLVTNSGTATLTGVGVTDVFTTAGSTPALTVSCPVTTLAPKAAMTCTGTYVVLQSDVDAGRIDNTATATGADQHGTVVTSTSSYSVTANQSPLVVTTKVADLGSVDTAGDAITYTITLANRGNVTLRGITITDALAAPGTPAAVVAGMCPPPTSLAPGEVWTCSPTYTVTQNDIDNGGDIVNTATATARDTNGALVGPSSQSATVTVTRAAGLSLTKTPSVPTIAAAGTPITYTFTVTNIGNVTISGLQIADTFTAPATSSTSPNCPVTTVAPNETVTCTLAYVATQDDIDHGSIDNSAVASGTAAGGGAVSSSASMATVDVVYAAALTVVKSASPQVVSAVGQVITFSFQVTNNGNVALSELTIVDELTAPAGPALNVSCPVTSLAPGGTTTCTAMYTVTKADIANDRITNTALATGTYTDEQAVTQTVTSAFSTVVVLVQQYTAVKTSDPAPGTPITQGQRVTYTISLVNTGGTDIAPTITDNLANVLDDATYNADAVATTGTLSQSGDKLVWNGTLGPDQSVTITYSITVKSYGEQGDHRLLNTITGAGPAAQCSDPTQSGCSVSSPIDPPVLPVVTGELLAYTGVEATRGALIAGLLIAVGAALILLGGRRSQAGR